MVHKYEIIYIYFENLFLKCVINISFIDKRENERTKYRLKHNN
jgi:hypothetical protein